jgi:uncharacterized membrane protein
MQQRARHVSKRAHRDSRRVLRVLTTTPSIVATALTPRSITTTFIATAIAANTIFLRAWFARSRIRFGITSAI